MNRTLAHVVADWPAFPMLVAGFMAMLVFASNAAAALITGVSAAATSELVSGALNRAAAHAVDGSGLSGNAHATSGEGAFWETVGIGAGFGADRAPAITFDLKEAFLLDTMRLWNFAEPTSATRRAEFLVSLDPDSFSSLGVHAFATAVNPAQDVDLGGVMARYVRLSILENRGGTVFPFSTGTPPTSGFAGLAEVQFFGSAVPEPSTLVLAGWAGILLLMAIWRSSHSTAE